LVLCFNRCITKNTSAAIHFDCKAVSQAKRGPASCALLSQLAADRLGAHVTGAAFLFQRSQRILARWMLTLGSVLGLSSDWLPHVDTAAACDCVAIFSFHHGF
jgi:hypothetical protein